MPRACERVPLAMPRASQRSQGTGPRATIKTSPLTVGRGPVPRHASRIPTIAGDRPPRYGKKRPPRTVGRGPVPRHASHIPTIAGDRPPRYDKKRPPPHRRARALACHTRMRAGSPRHASRIPTIAGDRPPRYDKKCPPPHRRARACPSPCLAQSNACGGRAPRHRKIETGRRDILVPIRHCIETRRSLLPGGMKTWRA